MGPPEKMSSPIPAMKAVDQRSRQQRQQHQIRLDAAQFEASGCRRLHQRQQQQDRDHQIIESAPIHRRLP
jgi:hypothetical protein